MAARSRQQATPRAGSGRANLAEARDACRPSPAMPPDVDARGGADGGVNMTWKTISCSAGTVGNSARGTSEARCPSKTDYQPSKLSARSARAAPAQASATKEQLDGATACNTTGRAGDKDVLGRKVAPKSRGCLARAEIGGRSGAEQLAGTLIGKFGTTKGAADYIVQEAIQRHATDDCDYSVVETSPTWKRYLQSSVSKPPAKSAAVGQKKCWGKRQFHGHPCKDSQMDNLVFGRSFSSPMLQAMEECGAIPSVDYTNGARTRAGMSGHFVRRRAKLGVPGPPHQDSLLVHDEHAPVELSDRSQLFAAVRQHSGAFAMPTDDAICDIREGQFPRCLRERYEGAAGNPSWVASGSGRLHLTSGPSPRAGVGGAILTSRSQSLRTFENNQTDRSAIEAVVFGRGRDVDADSHPEVYRGAAGQASWEKPVEDPHYSLPSAKQAYGQRRGIKMLPKTPTQMCNVFQSVYCRDETFEQDPAHHEQVVAATFDGRAGRASWHHTHASKRIEELRPATASEPLSLVHDAKRCTVTADRKERRRKGARSVSSRGGSRRRG